MQYSGRKGLECAQNIHADYISTPFLHTCEETNRQTKVLYCQSTKQTHTIRKKQTKPGTTNALYGAFTTLVPLLKQERPSTGAGILDKRAMERKEEEEKGVPRYSLKTYRLFLSTLGKGDAIDVAEPHEGRRMQTHCQNWSAQVSSANNGMQGWIGLASAFLLSASPPSPGLKVVAGYSSRNQRKEKERLKLRDSTWNHI